jgi:hypothetical protein
MSDYTVKELKDIARDKGLKGFSTMGKADLLKALQHAGYIKSHSPRKASRSARKASRSARKSPKKSRSRSSARKSRSSPSSVKKAVIGDFKKMLKADLVKLIKKTDVSFDIKATMKKDELIHVLEQMISRVTRPLSPGAASTTGLSVAELKRYALNDRGWKVGSMTKDNILETLSRESCNPEAGRFCSNASDTCDTRYNTCTGGAVSGKGLDEIVIDGHKIVGSSKSIAELKKKLSLKEVSPKKVSPKKVSPKKVSPKKGHTPLEQTLDEMTRGGVATREFRENLERLKACLGLAPN